MESIYRVTENKNWLQTTVHKVQERNCYFIHISPEKRLPVSLIEQKNVRRIMINLSANAYSKDVKRKYLNCRRLK